MITRIPNKTISNNENFGVVGEIPSGFNLVLKSCLRQFAQMGPTLFGRSLLMTKLPIIIL